MRSKSEAIFLMMKEIPSNYEGCIYFEKGLGLVVIDMLLTAIIADGNSSPPHSGSLLQSAYVESWKKDHNAVKLSASRDGGARLVNPAPDDMHGIRNQQIIGEPPHCYTEEGVW